MWCVRCCYSAVIPAQAGIQGTVDATTGIAIAAVIPAQAGIQRTVDATTGIAIAPSFPRRRESRRNRWTPASAGVTVAGMTSAEVVFLRTHGPWSNHE